jgi:putative hydrolase of the HAD superfamily
MVLIVVSTVVFDADETLVDLRPAVLGAMRVVLDEMRRLTPAAAELTVADLDADWSAAFRRMRAEPVTLIRREALARTLARAGLDSELDRIADLYFAHRFAAIRLYHGVPELLSELGRSYVLGLGTNGNSHAARVGLAGVFAFEICAHVDGVPKKPAAGFFDAVIAAAGSPPGSLVHVGDNWEHDVVGAAAAGLRTIWLNRSGVPRPAAPDATPDAEIGSLADLPAALRVIHSSTRKQGRPTAGDTPVSWELS